MVNHVAYGKCELPPERDSLLDTAKIMYSKKLWGGEFNQKMVPGGVSSEAWDRVSMIAPVKKYGRARLSTGL